LDHPPVRLRVPAFRAFGGYFGHCAELPLLLPHYYDLLLRPVLTADGTGLFQRLLPPTFGAYITPFDVVSVAESPALWTKFQSMNLRDTYPYKSGF